MGAAPRGRAQNCLSSGESVWYNVQLPTHEIGVSLACHPDRRLRTAMQHVIAPSGLRSWLAFALGVAAVALLAAAPSVARAADDHPQEIPYTSPSELPQLDPTAMAAPRKVVLIADEALNPRLVQLTEGEHVAWLSYSKIPSQIVFDRDTAKSMICHSLVNFTIKDAEIVSGDIHAGEFASFCELKPGRYKYMIRRPNPGSNAASARSRLEGEIIVTAKEEGAKK